MLATSEQGIRKFWQMNIVDTTKKAERIHTNLKAEAYRLPVFIDPAYMPYSGSKTKCSEIDLDMNELLITNAEDTFLIRVTGNSMINANIHPGDILIVDRKIRPENKRVIVAAIKGKLLVKRLKKLENNTILASDNPEYPDIKIQENDELDIWGVVTSVIKKI